MADRDPTSARGLPMVRPPDPAELERDRVWLQEQESRGALAQGWAYLRRGGPGYLQSALTLGGGSASASLLAGAAFGYDLLWVAPLGMIIGVIMLSAVAHQTLSTGMRPFAAMYRHAGPVFAWGWAIGALISSVVWHFAQYSLASAVLVDMGDAVGWRLSRGAVGLVVLVWAVVTAQMFGSGSKWNRRFDRLLKILVWTIIACFGLVVAKTGLPDWSVLARGYFGFRIPQSRGGVSGMALVLSGLAAAVVVNMVFLYPYTLLARGWGREHRKLARFDLVAGMLVPYVFATSLMVIAAANTIHPEFSGTSLSPVEAAQTLSGLVGPAWGRLVFHFGILGMVLTTITLHMVCTGFACSEIFGWQFGSLRYRLALLLPVPGVLGCFFWQEMSFWLAVPTGVLSGLLLPLVYLGFVKLQTSRAYLGGDRPAGWRGAAWLGGMVLATAVITTFFAWYLLTRGPGFLEQIFAPAGAAASN